MSERKGKENEERKEKVQGSKLKMKDTKKR